MFTNGPYTSIIGSGIIVLTWLNQIFLEQQLPQDRQGWFMFVVENLMGLGAMFSKDFNKTNSQHPTAISHTTPKVDASPKTV